MCNIKFLIAAVLLAHAALAITPLSPNAALFSQQGLARLFFQSRVTAQDPMISFACFNDYIARSNDIGEIYSKDYNECLLKATSSRDDVDLGVVTERKGIEVSSEGVCKRLITCNNETSTLDMFNCHANMGANNTKNTYAISGNASEFATLLQERYRLIDLHHEQCCHAAEREHVEKTANNYNHLQACLDGRVKPNAATTTPEPTTTTSTTSTTTTTTPPPTTTTTTTEAAAPLPTAEALTQGPQGMQQQFARLLNLLN